MRIANNIEQEMRNNKTPRSIEIDRYPKNLYSRNGKVIPQDGQRTLFASVKLFFPTKVRKHLYRANNLTRLLKPSTLVNIFFFAGKADLHFGQVIIYIPSIISWEIKLKTQKILLCFFRLKIFFS